MGSPNRSVPVAAAIIMDPQGEAVQALRGVLTPVSTLTTGAASSVAQDLLGYRAIILTLGADAWIRFGASDVADAAAASPSWYFRAGTYVIPVPLTSETTFQHATHFTVIQHTAAGICQVLGVS